MAAVYDLEIDEGFTFRRVFAWESPPGTPVNLTGFTAKAQIRRRAGQPVLYQMNDGVELVITPLAGEVEMEIPADAFASARWRRARWDLALTKAGERDRLVKGAVTLDRGITAP